MKRFFIITGILVSAILLFLFTFLIILPSSLIESWLEDGLKEKTGLTFVAEGFQKSPPFGFYMERVIISPINTPDKSIRGQAFGDGFQDRIKNPLFTFDKVQCRLSPSSIFSGGIKIFINGSAGDGRLEGAVFFKMDDTLLDIKASNIYLPYLDSIGLNKIVFNGQAHTVFSENGCPSGIIKAEGKDAKAVKINIMGFDVPFGEIKQTGMAIEMSECKILLEGLWIEGEGLSARLQGEISLDATIKNSPINMTLDIIPGRLFRENGLILAIIAGYRKSANNYSIPIKGTLGAPVMAR